eukprot:TRINITY_DN4733_c0_g2_i1.p1 TRINITY_DN4733_c0_g2~~TRINITY_DN4733_c0_g2_i1.p1  ORF type:complete len:323 (+),score=55.23 TRINITY_DN4733_c0_g2_i1:54-1022(+)
MADSVFADPRVTAAAEAKRLVLLSEQVLASVRGDATPEALSSVSDVLTSASRVAALLRCVGSRSPPFLEQSASPLSVPPPSEATRLRHSRRSRHVVKTPSEPCCSPYPSPVRPALVSSAGTTDKTPSRRGIPGPGRGGVGNGLHVSSSTLPEWGLDALDTPPRRGGSVSPPRNAAGRPAVSSGCVVRLNTLHLNERVQRLSVREAEAASRRRLAARRPHAAALLRPPPEHDAASERGLRRVADVDSASDQAPGLTREALSESSQSASLGVVSPKPARVAPAVAALHPDPEGRAAVADLRRHTNRIGSLLDDIGSRVRGIPPT